MQHILFVAGTFDEQGGRPSGYARKLAEALQGHLSSTTEMSSFNGGEYENLPAIMEKAADCDVIFWMADVPNHLPKFVETIKQKFPRKLLITSKRNLTEDVYSIQDVVSRALAIKSNLVLMVSGTRDNVLGTVLDPLGVAYCHEEGDIDAVAKALASRANRLGQFTRVRSGNVGPAMEVPDESEFFELIRDQADKFHEIIHGVGHERMLGNASFRCCKGFPSVRSEDGIIFVSRRNIDKRHVGREAFVATYLASNGEVEYWGASKPSVDTPIQLRLYDALPWVKYMLHSHTYVEGAPFTAEPVPCGAIEEVQEILRAIKKESAAVNILGHGSIIFAREISDMRNVPWIPRPTPEILP